MFEIADGQLTYKNDDDLNFHGWNSELQKYNPLGFLLLSLSLSLKSNLYYEIAFFIFFKQIISNFKKRNKLENWTLEW